VSRPETLLRRALRRSTGDQSQGIRNLVSVQPIRILGLERSLREGVLPGGHPMAPMTVVDTVTVIPEDTTI
jgi:hypothetical protein